MKCGFGFVQEESVLLHYYSCRAKKWGLPILYYSNTIHILTQSWDWKALNVRNITKNIVVNLNNNSIASNNDKRLQRLFPPRGKNSLSWELAHCFGSLRNPINWALNYTSSNESEYKTCLLHFRWKTYTWIHRTRTGQIIMTSRFDNNFAGMRLGSIVMLRLLKIKKLTTKRFLFTLKISSSAYYYYVYA